TLRRSCVNNDVYAKTVGSFRRELEFYLMLHTLGAARQEGQRVVGHPPPLCVFNSPHQSLEDMSMNEITRFTIFLDLELTLPGAGVIFLDLELTLPGADSARNLTLPGADSARLTLPGADSAR
ncbi:hypothetical protein L9F63_005662, partial [Diploptera punctata]